MEKKARIGPQKRTTKCTEEEKNTHIHTHPTMKTTKQTKGNKIKIYAAK